MDPAVSAAVREYHERFEGELEELEEDGAVRRLGHVADVPSALGEIGVILSSSVREGSHCSLVVGAASGAVPVVRDWPCYAGQESGASTLFLSDWVVKTPKEAVKRILAATATERGWREVGQAAADHALGLWDWSVVRKDYDRLFGLDDVSGVE